MKRQYGQATYDATVIMRIDKPADEDEIYEMMEDATAGLGNVEVMAFSIDDWSEDHECEAEMIIQIKEDCIMESWEPTWGDDGGDPGECSLSSEIDESDIVSAFADHGLTVSVNLSSPEFAAA